MVPSPHMATSLPLACSSRIRRSLSSGVAYRPVGAAALLRRNLLVYGIGGLILPFIGIKAIDLVVAALHLA